MFSGGLDSTAALYKLLTGSEDDLHVHHVHLMNRDGRARAERDAVQAVLAWCRANCRPFSYSESALDFEALQAIPIDYLSVAFAACQVIIDVPHCNRIAIGTLAVDLDEIKRKVSEQQRRVFHQSRQADFFNGHRIVGTEVYVARRGDSLWVVTQRYAAVPAWLLQHYNPDVDFADLRAGVEIVIPKVEALPPA
jgi:hypothetical protein